MSIYSDDDDDAVYEVSDICRWLCYCWLLVDDIAVVVVKCDIVVDDNDDSDGAVVDDDWVNVDLDQVNDGVDDDGDDDDVANREWC